MHVWKIQLSHAIITKQSRGTRTDAVFVLPSFEGMKSLNPHMINIIHLNSNEPIITRFEKYGQSRIAFISDYDLNSEDE